MCKILWDFSIMVKRPIYHDHPDIVAVDKLANQSYFIDVTMLGDVCVKTKTTEKLENQQNLQIITSSCGRYEVYHNRLDNTSNER